MYLFTRQTRLAAGHVRDGAEWAIAVTEKVNQIVSLEVGLWNKVFSPGVGSVSWGCMAESLVQLEEANAKLLADDMFVDLANRGASITTGELDDQTAQFIYQPDTAIDPRYVTVVQSALANGAFQRGVEAGVEIAQQATQLGGLPTSFLLGTTGAYGSVAWITAADSLEQLEQAEQAVNANPDFIKLIDEKASPCYLAGVTQQSIWQRLV
jgi:hypothetical protein